MFRFSTLSNLLGLSRSGKDRRRQASRQRRSVRLMLEQLEDRVVPAPIPVNTEAIAPADVVFSPQDQKISVVAKVTPADPKDNTIVDEGIVNFTVYLQGLKVGEAVTGVKVNSKGVAKTSYKLPEGTRAGQYYLEAIYADPLPNPKFKPQLFRPDYFDISPATVVLSPPKGPYKAFTPTGGKELKVSVYITDKSNNLNVIEGKLYCVIGSAASKQVTVDKEKNTYSLKLTLPQLKPGDYNIYIYYTDDVNSGGFGNYKNAETKVTLQVTKAQAAIIPNPAQDIFSPNPQTVALSANVADISDPSIPVNEGTVTFTVAGIGTVQGTVVNGVASADITIPGGEATGDYTIAVSYSDSSGDFVDVSNANATFCIAPASCAASSAALANQMVQNFASYFGDLEAQLFQDAQAVLNSLAAVMGGQQPLSALVQPWIQFYQLFSALQAVAQGPASTLQLQGFAEPSPAGTEMAASANPQMIGD